jgi:hypothetical protein
VKAVRFGVDRNPAGSGECLDERGEARGGVDHVVNISVAGKWVA